MSPKLIPEDNSCRTKTPNSRPSRFIERISAEGLLPKKALLRNWLLSASFATTIYPSFFRFCLGNAPVRRFSEDGILDAFPF